MHKKHFVYTVDVKVIYDDVIYDYVIKWKHFPRYWPFMRGIHRSPMDSPHKGQWRGALMFSSICAWINGWVNGEVGDLRRHRAHYDVIVMKMLNFVVRNLEYSGTNMSKTLRWRHNEHDCVSNHQLRECLLNRLFKAQIKVKSKLRVTALCEGNSPVTGKFPAQRVSNAENVSIWWRHHDIAADALVSCIASLGVEHVRKTPSWDVFFY